MNRLIVIIIYNQNIVVLIFAVDTSTELLKDLEELPPIEERSPSCK